MSKIKLKNFFFLGYRERNPLGNRIGTKVLEIENDDVMSRD